MKSVDVYWSFRSPYSYLAAKRLRGLGQKWDVPVRPRPVYPLAIRTPNFFSEIRPQWIPYLMKDIFRVAQYLDLPFAPPSPDPVVMNMITREIAEEQPYIHRLTRLGILASEVSDEAGWAFIDEVSTVIWSGQAWTEGTVLADAVTRAGLNLAEMDVQQEAETDRLTAAIEANQAEQDKHHWGVPLMVFEDEGFFGQDRLDLLEWRLDQAGIARR
ncbi:MAG: DsbA family protein [Pseudomonadota bacterium]